MVNDTTMDKIKKLEEEIAKKKAALLREKGKLSEKDRKARTRELIQIGGLSEIAGLRNSDKGFLLGVLLKAKEIDPSSTKYLELKAMGDRVLDESKKKVEVPLQVSNG